MVRERVVGYLDSSKLRPYVGLLCPVRELVVSSREVRLVSAYASRAFVLRLSNAPISVFRAVSLAVVLFFLLSPSSSSSSSSVSSSEVVSSSLLLPLSSFFSALVLAGV